MLTHHDLGMHMFDISISRDVTVRVVSTCRTLLALADWPGRSGYDTWLELELELELRLHVMNRT